MPKHIGLRQQRAEALRSFGFTPSSAWAFVSAGFGAGALIYYGASLFLERKGAAVRYASQFKEYALARKKQDVGTHIAPW